MHVDPKIKAVRERIKHLEIAIVCANDYLETGKHARWQAFNPIFVYKFKNGEELPPHKDWVKNVFLPHVERSLSRSQKLLERLEIGPTTRKAKRRPSIQKTR